MSEKEQHDSWLLETRTEGPYRAGDIVVPPDYFDALRAQTIADRRNDITLTLTDGQSITIEEGETVAIVRGTGPAITLVKADESWLQHPEIDQDLAEGYQEAYDAPRNGRGECVEWYEIFKTKLLAVKDDELERLTQRELEIREALLRGEDPWNVRDFTLTRHFMLRNFALERQTEILRHFENLLPSIICNDGNPISSFEVLKRVKEDRQLIQYKKCAIPIALSLFFDGDLGPVMISYERAKQAGFGIDDNNPRSTLRALFQRRMLERVVKLIAAALEKTSYTALLQLPGKDPCELQTPVPFRGVRFHSNSAPVLLLNMPPPQYSDEARQLEWPYELRETFYKWLSQTPDSNKQVILKDIRIG